MSWEVSNFYYFYMASHYFYISDDCLHHYAAILNKLEIQVGRWESTKLLASVSWSSQALPKLQLSSGWLHCLHVCPGLPCVSPTDPYQARLLHTVSKPHPDHPASLSGNASSPGTGGVKDLHAVLGAWPWMLCPLNCCALYICFITCSFPPNMLLHCSWCH